MKLQKEYRSSKSLAKGRACELADKFGLPENRVTVDRFTTNSCVRVSVFTKVQSQIKQVRYLFGKKQMDELAKRSVSRMGQRRYLFYERLTIPDREKLKEEYRKSKSLAKGRACKLADDFGLPESRVIVDRYTTNSCVT